MKNGIILQYFEWNLPPDNLLWLRCAAQAEKIREEGFTAVWLPPAYKGSAGGFDVGYGVYDMYDLGEFDQKGSVKTKYGSFDDYLHAIHTLQWAGIQVLGDVVFNHRMGADATEVFNAAIVDDNNRMDVISAEQEISAWTKFSFPGRKGKYSDFNWDYRHFKGIDYDEKSQNKAIYLFEGKQWSQEIDDENGNYDYLMGADVDFSVPEVKQSLIDWGKWYLDTTGLDGLRLDAVKHIDFHWFPDWLSEIRAYTGREIFSVGEYWNADLDHLKHYLSITQDALSLFDVPLHYKFYEASYSNGNFDMRTLLDDTLVSYDPVHAVTFVDNHDTQARQSLFSWVDDWFKPLAYAVILLREGGYPCVFYGDYYGIPYDNIAPARLLRLLLQVRLRYAYGTQHDYFDDANVVGWTREGDADVAHSGVAVLMSDGAGGEKKMYIGKQFSGHMFRDCTGRDLDAVVIDDDGNGVFRVKGGAVSVWVQDSAHQDLFVTGY